MGHHHSRSVAAACLAALLLGAGPALPEPATRPAGASRPASGPSDPRARAELKLAKLKAKYGNALTYEIDDPLRIVFATALDRRTLAEVRQTMAAHARALSHDLFEHAPEGYLSVVIPGSWHNDRVTGHFYPPDFVDARSIGSNLKHEYTHALHYADQAARDQEHPVWIMEGLASLFETSDLVDGRLVPKVDRRLPELQAQVRHGGDTPWAKLLKLEHRQFTSHQYAQARYMLLYLYRNGRLKSWYDAYTAGYAGDPSGGAAFEKVIGKPLAEIEKDWKTWVLKLTPPGAPRAVLGVRTSLAPDGLQVEQVVREDGALAVHDVVLAVAGERVVDPEDLADTLARREPGEQVEVRYRRGSRYAETKLALLPVPDARPATPPTTSGAGRKTIKPAP